MPILLSLIYFHFYSIWVLLRESAGVCHIFYKQDIEEILNVQPIGNKAKPYQVKQVRNVILKYKMDV
jgi:hypothetical protein